MCITLKIRFVAILWESVGAAAMFFLHKTIVVSKAKLEFRIQFLLTNQFRPVVLMQIKNEIVANYKEIVFYAQDMKRKSKVKQNATYC